MKSTFWFVAGVATTAYGAVKVRKATDMLTPEGRADRWSAMRHGASVLAIDVREASRARKEELRRRYGLSLGPSGAAIETHAVPELEEHFGE